MELNYQDKIDDYLLGRMSEKERQCFEKEILDNESIRNQLAFTQQVLYALENRNRKLAAMKAWGRV